MPGIYTLQRVSSTDGASRSTYSHDSQHLLLLQCFYPTGILELAEAEVYSRVGAIVTAAHAYRANGDVTLAAEREVAAADALIRAMDNPFAALRSITLLARLYVLQGRLRQAAATYAQVEQLIPRPEILQTFFSSLYYYFGLGDLLRERNELEAAEQHLAQGMALVKETMTVEPFVALLGYTTLARLQQARGNTREALAILDALVHLAEQRHFPPHLLTQVAAVRAQLALAQGNVAAAIHWANSSGPSAGDDDRQPVSDAASGMREDCLFTPRRGHHASQSAAFYSPAQA